MSKIFNKVDARIISMFVVSIIMFFLVGIVAANSYYTFKNVIYNGVSIAGVSVGGLTQEEAKEKIGFEIEKIYSQPVLQLKYGEQNWDISKEDIDLQIDKNALVDNAYKVGREGTLVDKIQDIFFSFQKGYNVNLITTYNEKKVENIITNISTSLNKKPANANIKIIDGKPKIEPEINGLTLKQTEANKLISDTINKQIPSTVELPVEITKPQIIKDDLTNITDVLGTYSSYFNSYLVYRSHNVNLASDYLDGILLKPGEIFSFDKGIGPRSIERGYRNAPVFEGEEIIDGIGGGICQVSSTLYLAALYADLEIVERSNHYRPVGYVPIGQDATIAEGVIDLKFKNSTPHNIYIHSWVDGNKVTVQIFGKKPPDFPTIKVVSYNVGVVEPKTVIKKDANLPIGKKVTDKEGEKGYTASTYRLKYKGDTLIEEEHLFDDYYPAIDKVIKEGTKKQVVKQNPKTNENQ